MKTTFFITRLILTLAVVTLLGLTTRTWAAGGTFPTNTYTQSFLTGGNSAPFAGSGSVASWISWYDTPGNNSPLTNDVTTPDPGAGLPGTVGSLMVDNPFTNGNQNLFFGTFGNQTTYDWSTQVDLAPFDTIAFDVYVKPVNPNNGQIVQTSSSTNFGTLQVGVMTPAPAAIFFGSVTIPASASNGWVHLTMPINHAIGDQSHIGGIAFNYNNYGGYPTNDFVFWIGHLTMHYNPGQSNPPPRLLSFQKPVVGLNMTDTQVTGNQYNRYQVETATSTGYSFANHPTGTVTYSWDLKSFPTNSPNGYQQHFFIVNGNPAGRPGLYDQAADWNLANCIFITVQQDSNGFAFMNFRYKTNEPGGNAMIYNTATNNWPIEPVGYLPTSNYSALGTWSVSFNNQTNVTLTAPHGQTTNFVLDPASAALFADPVTPILGAQPNDTFVVGESVIYNSFSVTGNDRPLTDIFTNDSQLSTNWTILANDPNGVVLVPPNAVYWLPWTLPDTGFSLQTNSNLAISSNWDEVAFLSQVQNSPTNRAALLGVNAQPSPNQGFFRLHKRTYTQLQVLWPGETNSPSAPTGKIGTPNPASYNVGDTIPVTVNGCDSTWHIVNITGSSIYLYSQTDAGANIAVTGGPLVNGTANLTITYITVTNAANTVTAGDSIATNTLQGTSSVITIN